MSVAGLEVDITNYSGRKDFQVTAEFVDKRHYTIQVRRLDTTKGEGWTENLKVLANFYNLDKPRVVFIGSSKQHHVKFVGVETDFDIEKSGEVEAPLAQYSLPTYPGAQQVSRANFNRIFSTDVVVLPTSLFAVGVKNGCVYTYNEGYELLFQIELTIKNIVNVALSKNLFSEFYFIICADDGYMEYHYPSDRTNPVQIDEKQFAGQKIVKLDDASAFAVLHKNKYVLAQNNQKGTAYTFAMPDRYYFYLNRFNEYRSVHEGIPFKTKKAEIVYGSNPRGFKFNFTQRRDIEVSPREYFYSDAVPKTNIVAPKWIKRSDMVKSKYILDIDGNASTWDATAWKLNSGSVILKSDSCWNQWFFDKFKAWEHYVPVKDDFSDLQDQFAWCEGHQEECEKMIRNCKKLFQQVYRFQTVSDYIVDKLYEMNSIRAYEVNDRRLFLFNRERTNATDYKFNTGVDLGGPLQDIQVVCKNLNKNDLVVYFHDFCNIDINKFDPKQFMETFDSFGKKIVVAAEKNLWPDSLEQIRYKLMSIAPQDSDFKYPQSGVLCGEVGELLRLFEERIIVPEHFIPQDYLAKAYVTDRYSMVLDYYCKLSIAAFKCNGEELDKARAGGVPFVNFNAGR
jgi:Glycosyl transferase family 90